MPSIIRKSNRKNIDIVAKGRVFPSLKDFFSISLTFILTSFAWIFFRAESVGNAPIILASKSKITSSSLDYLSANKPQVLMLGGPSALGKPVEGDLSLAIH